MDVIAMPFGVMGFIFALSAMAQANAASAQLKDLERRLADAGVVLPTKEE